MCEKCGGRTGYRWLAQSASLLLFPITTLFSSALFYLGLGFAILRYRLGDIDMLINHSLVYGTLTAIPTTVYIGLIIGLQALIDQHLFLCGYTHHRSIETIGFHGEPLLLFPQRMKQEM
jgi:hypothetical protein